MKTQIHLMAIIIACAGITATTKAQTWLLGGNPPNGGNGTVTNSNFFAPNAF